VEEEHEVHRWCRLVSHYSADADWSDLSLAVPPHPVRAGVTIVHPGAKSPTRRWPASRYAAVARALAERGHRVVVTGSLGERDVAVRVAREAGLPRAAALAGRTGIGELAGLVAHARLVISGDTGVAHLATAYGTPSVVLFGPVSPQHWGAPPERPQHRALWAGSTGDTFADRPDPGLLRITITDVLAAADRLIDLTSVN
jgi:ADP-heptose:LPS heptosyltransferase